MFKNTFSNNNTNDDERLVPRPHVIKSIRSRNWNLIGAVGELVDNSLGHGHAKNIVVVIVNGNAIQITDDGIGMDDINRFFRLGDASAFGDSHNIGQYGVGATDASIFLGDETTVETVRDGLHHGMTVNWAEVDRTQQWPRRYRGAGSIPVKNEIRKGTRVTIRKLHSNYKLNTGQKLAGELGRIYAPAVRDGAVIRIAQQLASGETEIHDVKAFTPPDLTKAKVIVGQIETKRGTLRWHGRMGLSDSLTDRTNGVHIAFGHRVIEVTRDPFNGQAAPTLYVEVILDSTTPWKHSLSDHKDKVVHHRKELMQSIHDQIAAMLRESREQTTNLKLNALSCPIETAINRVLSGLGDERHDPAEDPIDPQHGETDTPIDPDSPSHPRDHSPTPEGEPAKPKNPRGIQVRWVDQAYLDGKAYSWSLENNQMILELDRDEFAASIDWPIKQSQLHFIHLIAAVLSTALQTELLDNGDALKRVLSGPTFRQMSDWANESNYKIAPRLTKLFLDEMKRGEKRAA